MLLHELTFCPFDLPYKKVWEITRRKKFGTNQKIRSHVLWGEYVIDYLKGKHLKVWKLRDPDQPYKDVFDKNGNATGERKLDAVAYINIEDAFGFYQESFVKATESLIELGYLSQDDHHTIKTNKDQREQFNEKSMSEIKRYCGLELVTLAKALTVLRDGVDAMGIPALRSWTGPGVIAEALIKKYELKERHYSPDIVTKNPSPQQICAHHAFVGGRIELLKQGYLQSGALWVYDIASAYPAAMQALPSMRGGMWTHHDKNPKDNAGIRRTNMLSMFCVRWDFPLEAANGWPIPFYPFPYRITTAYFSARDSK